MKRIFANKRDEDLEFMMDYLDDYLYKAGYSVGDGKLEKMELKCDQDEEFMPKVTLFCKEQEDGGYMINFKFEYPTLDTTDDTFQDHLEYVTKRWHDSARYFTSLIGTVVNPADYRDE